MNTYDKVFEMLRLRASFVGTEFAFFKTSFWEAKRKRILAYLCMYLFICFSFIDVASYSRRFLNRRDLVKLAANSSVLTMILAAVFGLNVLRSHSQLIFELFELLRNLHVTQFPCLKRIYRQFFDKAYERAELLLKFLSVVCVFAFFSAIFINVILILVLDYSKFPLPIFYELRFLPKSDWPTYLVNFGHQAAIALVIVLTLQCLGAMHFIITVLVFAKMDCTIWIVKEMVWVSEELESFDEWIKEVMESVHSCRQILLKYRQIALIYFYFFEKVNYVCLFVTLLVLKVDPELVGLSMSGMAIVLVLLVIVAINEMTLDKFKVLNSALYDLPWYEMKPRDRKKLLVLIQVSQNAISLSAGGIQDLKFEWFSELVKNSYSVSIFLQNMVDV